jgi:hypothetical protein
MERFAAACERVRVSVDTTSVASFEREANALENLATKLNAGERDELLAELRLRRTAIKEVKSAPADASMAITRPKPGTAHYNAIRAGEAAKIQREASERLRASALDRTTPAAIAKSDAIDRITAVIGDAQTEGWNPAFEYLAENSEKIAGAERRYADAAAKVAKGGDAKAVKELEAAAKSRDGYHSKVKGLLGEGYASQCKEFLDLREAFYDLAKHRVAELNRQARRLGTDVEWEVVLAKGTLKIDGKEAWDEAILIVEKLRPGLKRPRAELVMAAQYKVEQRVSALAQIKDDVTREAGKLGTPAIFSHTVEGGAQRNYVLMASDPTNRPTRFLFNAEGGSLSKQQIETFARGNVQAQQGTLRMSVDQFDTVADELLAATASVAGK